ncbi:hypothetical protein [Caballeronia mineralivorans]|uniref:hypothetical protein n=1 Tax=Caballeronia mineralivorans TaxID=2010198 RepID=UPI0023F2E43C|nr:hypothetical protein [Caballeronia mineralivorans]
MFPKGLGGDDRRFMLVEMVCGHCNTDVFSKLEASFMRNSPVAIARIFMQKIKGSGTDAIIPRFDTRSTTVVSPEHGEVEAEMLAEGVAVILPQLLLLGDDKCAMTGSDESAVPSFLEALRSHLGDAASLVHKVASPDGTRFDITDYQYRASRYIEQSSYAASKPPGICIWREHFPVIDQSQRSSRHPTLYRRSAGQIVLRTHQESDARHLLTVARAAVEALEHVPLPTGRDIENPSMLFSISVDMDAFGRVLTKIGLNLVAHSFGEDYIRHSAFDITKAAVLGRTQEGIHYETSGADAALKMTFSGVPHARHAMTLVAIPTSRSTCNVALLLRLYGAITYAVHLGTDAPPPPNSMPLFHVIDYNTHRIEELSAIDFIRKYPPQRVTATENQNVT